MSDSNYAGINGTGSDNLLFLHRTLITAMHGLICLLLYEFTASNVPIVSVSARRREKIFKTFIHTSLLWFQDQCYKDCQLLIK